MAGSIGLIALLVGPALARVGYRIAGAADREAIAGSWAGRLGLVARIVLWTAVLAAASGAFLASGVLLLLILALDARPGHEILLTITKAVGVGGWVAIGAWLFYEYWNVRVTAIAPPILAWVWTYIVGTGAGSLGVLNWGP